MKNLMFGSLWALSEARCWPKTGTRQGTLTLPNGKSRGRSMKATAARGTMFSIDQRRGYSDQPGDVRHDGEDVDARNWRHHEGN